MWVRRYNRCRMQRGLRTYISVSQSLRRLSCRAIFANRIAGRIWRLCGGSLAKQFPFLVTEAAGHAFFFQGDYVRQG